MLTMSEHLRFWGEVMGRMHSDKLARADLLLWID